MFFDNGCHSTFSLYYHLIVVVKYRKRVIDDAVSARLKEIFEYIQPTYQVCVEKWNHDRDHVHMLFAASPSTDLTKFINVYKSASSRLIKQEFPQVKQQLWKEHFWSRGFCIISVGDTPIEVLRRYIDYQGQQ